MTNLIGNLKGNVGCVASRLAWIITSEIATAHKLYIKRRQTGTILWEKISGTKSGLTKSSDGSNQQGLKIV